MARGAAGAGEAADSRVMTMNAYEDEQPEGDELDRSVTKRLSKLRTMPVDSTRLDRALREQLPARRSR